MALTRAQLLSGNSADGNILSGQPQGVRPGGAGITIGTDGIISVNSQTIQGVLKLGQTPASAAAAFNGYTWPTGPGSAGQQLQTDGAGILSWSSANASPYTAKGQLVVGTGLGADTLLNVGTDGFVLVSDSTATSGLKWITTAGLAVAYTQTATPTSPVNGQLWYDCNTGTLKVYQTCVTPNGWASVNQTGLGVLPGNTSSAPAFASGTGTSADPYVTSATSVGAGGGALVVNVVTIGGLSPFQYVPIIDLNANTNGGRFSFTNNFADAAGNLVFQVIFNDSPISAVGASYTASIKVGYSSVYATAGITITSNSPFVRQSSPTAPAGATSNALIPSGTTAQRQTSPVAVDGSMRFNTDTDELEVFGPLGWKTVPSSSTGAFAAQTVPTAPATATPNVVVPAGSTTDRQTAPAVTAGQIRYNTTTGKLEVYGGGGAWETLPSSSTGAFAAQTIPTAPATATPNVVVPSGSTTDRQTAPAVTAGQLRYNTTNNEFEGYGGSPAAWAPLGGGIEGLGINITGGIVKLKMPVAITPPAAGTGAAQAIDGSMYWDSALGQLFIRYNDGTTSQWVAAAPAGASSSLSAASLAEAAAGTSNTKYSSPSTAVPKTTADMTGFAILPSSATASTVAAQLHYNTTSLHLEYGNGTVSKTAVEREGDNMTGKLSVTPSTIAAGVGGWLLTTSNYWTVGAIAFPLPTGLSAGQGGLVRITAAPTSWPAAGGILKYTGGTAPAPTAFPAILPYYSDGTNVYLGTATEGIV